ncbi:MAG: trypsin-like peptidase domain-containing protein [Cyanobacteria bacterium SZAS-4]|nr:trypsin-like peptidase domain-containing protein [Cyanobacteria bacterium SZAS-4]
MESFQFSASMANLVQASREWEKEHPSATLAAEFCVAAIALHGTSKLAAGLSSAVESAFVKDVAGADLIGAVDRMGADTVKSSRLLAGESSASPYLSDNLQKLEHKFSGDKAYIPFLQVNESGERVARYLKTNDQAEIHKLYSQVKPSVVRLDVQRLNQQATFPGSGFFIDENRIATNHHVVKGAASISVKTYDGQIFKGVVLGRDKHADLAIVEIENTAGAHFPKLKLGARPKLDSHLYAVGHPLGAKAEVMSTGKNESFVLNFNWSDKLKRTPVTVAPTGESRWRTGLHVLTVPVEPGSSGSPLLNTQGEVVGIIREARAKGNIATAVEHLATLNHSLPTTIAERTVQNVQSYYWEQDGRTAAQALSSRPMTGFERAKTLMGRDTYPAFEKQKQFARVDQIVDGKRI